MTHNMPYMVRTFATGATRDVDDNKIDPSGALSPLVIRRYAEYMLTHQIQSDGQLRSSSNWQRGIPFSAYMSSLWRHFLDLWTFHWGWTIEADIEDVLCAILFNAQGYLFEILKQKTEIEKTKNTFLGR